MILLWFGLVIWLNEATMTFDFELDLNEEEIYPVLDEASAEVDELDEVLLSCNEKAEIYTRGTIKNLFRSNHFNKLDEEKSTNHVLGWQIMNNQKHFSTNLTYLIIKQIQFKDSGIYYCVVRMSYFSYLSSILPNTLVSNLSKLWSACQASGQLECLASFKYKLIVRKSKKRSLNSIRLPEEFKEKCFVIKNGKQIVQDRLLSFVAMFLATLIFILLLIYFIYIHRDNFIVSTQVDKRRKVLKKQRNEQINENLEIIKSFEHIRQDEKEVLKRLRMEQERLSTKRREDEEFFNRMKSEELDLVKRKEQVVKEEEELLKKRIKFEQEKKTREEDERQINERLRAEDEMCLRERNERKIAEHLGDEYEMRIEGRRPHENESINVNIKGEINLKSQPENNKSPVELNNYDHMNEMIVNLSKKMKKTRKKIFEHHSPVNESIAQQSSPFKSEKPPVKLPRLLNEQSQNFERTKLGKMNYEKYRNFSNIRTGLFNRETRSPTSVRSRFDFGDKLKLDRKALLKRKLAKATTNIVLNEFNHLNRLNNVNRPLINFLDKPDGQSKYDKRVDVESTIDIRRKNESIFKTSGKFKIDSNLCNKPMRLVIETPAAVPNKVHL